MNKYNTVNKKIGFWPVFALVIGSQIGSGVFMLPASLAPYGGYGILGWIISGCGAITLACVFAFLCSRMPKTGGPHVYVAQAFGPSAAFFTGWTYWVISWVSTTAVIVACIGYLLPLIGAQSTPITIMLELALLFAVTLLNLKGVQAAGRAEFILTLLKFIPLLLIPLAALFLFNTHNFTMTAKAANLSTSSILSKVSLLALWGFIGLETATTPAGSIKNPGKTIPIAIITGTTCVCLLYLLNSIGIMGLISGTQLQHSIAPYADATRLIFGGNWHLFIALISSIVCIGNLNAWILTSGQIALGIAEDNLMPSIFTHKNRFNAPKWGLITSSLGICPLLILTGINTSIAEQLTTIIDISVIAFLFVYLICCLALIKTLLKESSGKPLYQVLIGCSASLFCSWIIIKTPMHTILTASIFIISGLPMYFLWYRKKLKNNK